MTDTVNRILKFLYEKSIQTQRHVDGKEIMNHINVTEQELRESLQDLEDNGFVNIIRPSGYPPKAIITASGRGHIRNQRQESSPVQFRILLAAANPDNDLKVTNELEFIQDELMLKSVQKEKFRTVTYQALTKSDFIGLLTEFKPYIVHFSGHGIRDGALVVIGKDGEEKNLVGPNELTEIFSIVKSQFKVHCVVMNACYSEKSADELIKHVDYVIGVSGRVADEVAIDFAIKFYEGIGNGYSVKDAFSLAKIALTDSVSGLSVPFVLKSQS